MPKEAAQNWSNYKDARQGAALAYYSVFSLGPLILIAIAIAGFFFGREAVAGEVTSSITGLLGETGAKAVEAMLAESSRPREGVLATVVGLGLLVFAAIGVVVQLKDALNTVWEVEEPSGGGIWSFLRSYVVSLGAVLALGFLLLVSLLVTAVLAAAGKYAAPSLSEGIFQAVSILVSFSVIAVLFAMMFKGLPDAEISWHDVWLGAVFTALLFELGKSAIAVHIGKQGLESTYGAAASIIIVMIWVYYSSQIILMGAEFTHAFANRHGSKKNAMGAPDSRAAR